MSQSERGEPSAAGLRPGPAARPSLDRPSLFAGMEDDHSPHTTAKRVRILSTLDAPRGGTRKAGPRHGAAPDRHPRRSWALWALMGGGMACVIGGLWLSSMAEQAPTTSRPPQAVASAPEAAPRSSASPTDSPVHPDAPLTALIESNPTSAPPTASAASGPQLPLADVDADGTASPLALLNNTPSPPGEAAARPPTAKASRASPAKVRSPTRQSDDDVALLEAMFAHAGQRKPPRSASEELERRCGPLQGAEARACRTKVCKRYPDARVCR